MLKAEVNGREGLLSLSVSGDMPSICAEISIILRKIYSGIEGEREKCFFVDCIKNMANDELYTKTKEEFDELTMKIRKKHEKSSIKELADDINKDEDLTQEQKRILNDLCNLLDGFDGGKK